MASFVSNAPWQSRPTTEHVALRSPGGRGI